MLVMATSARLLECLGHLEHAKYDSDEASRESNLWAERVLETVLHGGQNRDLPTSDEQVKKFLLITAPYTRAHIERVACLFRTRLEYSVLRKRSAIQFLIDNFGLSEEFSESAEILDQVIYTMRDLSDSDSEDPQPAPDCSRIPKHHTWWPQELLNSCFDSKVHN